MAENDFDYQEDLQNEGNDDSVDRNSRQFVRQLEEQAKAGKDAKREADAARREAENAKRELAFLKAGIDIESPTGKLFAKAYDGDSSIDSVKAAATEYGLIATSETADVKNDLDALSRVSQASAGSTGSVAPSALDGIRNAEGPADILRILQENNIPISNEQPSGWVSLV